MANRLRIFISSEPALQAEREAVGRAVASLPISLGWVIKYTPGPAAPSTISLRAVGDSHFYVLVLAKDIKAPVGAELRVARQTGKNVMAFLKDGPRTAAARVFIRQSRLEWHHFAIAAELGPLLQRTLAEQIAERAEAYGLNLTDWESLSSFLDELKRQEGSEQLQEDAAYRYRGAGKDGIIVGPGRDVPNDGTPIEKPQRPP